MAADIRRRHPLRHRQHDLERIPLQWRRLDSRKALRHVRNTSDLLTNAFEKISVWRELDDLEAQLAQVMFIEIPVEAGRIVKGCKGGEAPKRRGDAKRPAVLQDPAELLERARRLG